MKLSLICEKLGLETVIGEIGDRDVSGVYTGDLLSRAMSHVKADNIWITIMSNKNVVAVAELTEPCAVILSEGVKLADDAAEAAEENGLTVLSTELSSYELCVKLGSILNE